MLDRTLRFFAMTALFVAAGAAGPRSVVIEVEAGPHERKDTPIVVPLPDSLKSAHLFALHQVDGGASIPVQSTAIGTPAVAWLDREPIRAGTSRRYRLTSLVVRVSQNPLRFSKDSQDRTILLEDRPILSYHVDVAEPPPGIEPIFRRSGFIHPLATRSGLVVTDDFPPDHAHQHGLFFAWVNTTFEGRHLDFWNQKSRTANVSHDAGRSATTTASGPVLAEFTVPLRHDDLIAPAGPIRVLDETWTVRAYDVPGLVVVDVESAQSCAGASPLTINKYHYGGLGLRGNRAWFDPKAAGNDPPDPARCGRSDFLTSEGRHRSDGNHTRPRWVDLYGEVDGRMGGVAILDHPSNFRFPQPVRLHPNKPYFCFAPMVLGEFEIAPGTPYVSRYRIVAHDGPPDPKLLDRLWDDYADPPRVRVVDERP